MTFIAKTRITIILIRIENGQIKLGNN